MRAGALIVAITFAIVHVAPAGAQEGDDWIGKRVLPRLRDLTLRVSGDTVEQNSRVLTSYKVEQADGASLLLTAEGGAPAVGSRPPRWSPSRKPSISSPHRFARTRATLSSMRCSRSFTLTETSWISPLREYNEALGIDPRDPAVLCGRGSVWLAKKQYDKAIADFDHALELDPKNTVGYIGRGNSHAAKSAFTKAIADFSEAIWLDPLSLAAYLDRGNAWQSKKEWAKAIVDYNVIIRLDPEHAQAFCQRGVAWAADGKYDRALADMSEAVRLDPRHARAYRVIAWLLATCPDTKLRDGKRAVESATKACQLTDWRDAASLDVLAAACASSGDFESAVRWQTKAIATGAGSGDQAGRQKRLEHYRAMAANH